MHVPRLDIKLVTFEGKDYFCSVLPYIPPTPLDEQELGWPKQPIMATARPTQAYVDPWDYVNTKMDSL